MLFNSIDYILFFIVVAFTFFLLNPKYRWILLLASSYFFYMCWKWEFIFLILFSTLVDYYCGLQMAKRTEKKERKPFLYLSLLSNLGLLFFFKYFNFFSSSISDFVGANYDPIHLILPMGISFYTFQTLAYTVDIYEGRISCEKHLGKFALYVSFFPQLVAGPIERAERLLPQLQENLNKLRYSNVINGLTKVMIGLFKKVVVADTIAIYVETIYGAHELHTGFTLLFATYLFAIQIYCDFSGYTDIAIGSARILGYDLMENFNNPYFSKSITEFWRRWHISLSSWLRDYLYIPLGGNRLGNIFTYRNLMITMLLGGLWHGAGWNFIIWGMLHGVYLSIERLFHYGKLIESKGLFLKVISGIISFHLVCLAWVFFRAENYVQAIEVINGIFTADYFFNLSIKDSNVFGSILICTCILIFLEIKVFKNLNLRNDTKPNFWKLVSIQTLLLLLIIGFGISEGSQFIYFQF